MIQFHEESKTFHLYNDQISYIFKILKNNQLGQLYYGKRIHDRDNFDHLFETSPRPMSWIHSHLSYAWYVCGI